MLSSVVRLIANHQSSAASKTYQKSGSFPPLALPSLGSTMTLSDTRADHRRDDVGGATSARSGLPRLPGSPFRHAVPNYPDGPEWVRLSVASPSHASLPRTAGGSASMTSLSRPARASLALRPTGLLSRPRRLLSRGSDPAGCPAKPLVS